MRLFLWQFILFCSTFLLLLRSPPSNEILPSFYFFSLSIYLWRGSSITLQLGSYLGFIRKIPLIWPLSSAEIKCGSYWACSGTADSYSSVANWAAISYALTVASKVFFGLEWTWTPAKGLPVKVSYLLTVAFSSFCQATHLSCSSFWPSRSSAGPWYYHSVFWLLVIYWNFYSRATFILFILRMRRVKLFWISSDIYPSRASVC